MNWAAGYADDRRFDPHVRQQYFVEIGQEIFSTANLSLPLIQEGQLRVTGKECALSTGELPGRLAQEQCDKINWPRPKWHEKCWWAVKQQYYQPSNQYVEPSVSLWSDPHHHTIFPNNAPTVIIISAQFRSHNRNVFGKQTKCWL